MSKKISVDSINIEKKFLDSSNLKESLLAALLYKSVFNIPSSKYQLLSYLPGYSLNKKDLKKVNLFLDELVEKDKIKECFSNHYYIKKFSKKKYINRQDISKEYIKKSTAIIEMLSKIPWIEFIGITGSVASILKIASVYLHSSKNKSGKFCPNLYLSTNNLSWKTKNIFVAHEIVTIYPLLNKNNTYLKFLSENKWVFDYFPNKKPFEYSQNFYDKKHSYILDMFEALLKKLQYLYMQHSITNEVLEDKLIHFNKNDHSEKILNSFRVLLSKYL
jgi:hypothetical protein